MIGRDRHLQDFVKEQGVSNLPAVHAWKGGLRIEVGRC